MSMLSLDQHIELTPDVCGGRPRIAGRRIRVQDIAEWHVHQGQSVESIADDFRLTFSDVYAALAYYFDHQQEIEDAMERDRVWEEKAKIANPSLISPEVREAYYRRLREQPEPE